MLYDGVYGIIHKKKEKKTGAHRKIFYWFIVHRIDIRLLTISTRSYCSKSRYFVHCILFTPIKYNNRKFVGIELHILYMYEVRV